MRDGTGDVQSMMVLGGASDIAQATVRALAARRLRTVSLGARRPGELAQVADSLGASGVAVRTFDFDALEVSSHGKVIDAEFDALGDVDLVMIAFGQLGRSDPLEADPEEAAELTAVNYSGAVSAAIAASRRLRQQGHGTLIIMSSVAGVRTRAANFTYGSTKAGLDAFARGLGHALAGSGVSVMVVRPGFVHTKMTAGMAPAPLSTDAESVAAAIVEGVRTGASVVWAPRGLKWLFLGLRALPDALWRRLPG